MYYVLGKFIRIMVTTITYIIMYIMMHTSSDGNRYMYMYMYIRIQHVVKNTENNIPLTCTCIISPPPPPQDLHAI